jgi:hypothetical protein
MNNLTQFQQFSDNTQSMCIIIGVALFILIITSISASSSKSFMNRIGKICAAGLLGYALFVNCKETTNLINTMPNIFTDPNITGIRNNTILSYIFSFIILLAIVYVTFTIF